MSNLGYSLFNYMIQRFWTNYKKLIMTFIIIKPDLNALNRLFKIGEIIIF